MHDKPIFVEMTAYYGRERTYYVYIEEMDNFMLEATAAMHRKLARKRNSVAQSVIKIMPWR